MNSQIIQKRNKAGENLPEASTPNVDPELPFLPFNISPDHYSDSSAGNISVMTRT
jgi:hypothetical protein